MSIKVFQTNEKGKIEFTRCELEKLLNEIYKEGYAEGEKNAKGTYWTWSNPHITPYYGIRGSEVYCKDNDTITVSTSASDPATVTTTTTARTFKTPTCEFNGAEKLPVDLQSLAGTIEEIFGAKEIIKPQVNNDPISNLAKELHGL